MTRNLKISLQPLRLDRGTPKEVATFGHLIITLGDDCLTEGIEQDADAPRYRPGPYVSGYHLAEWLVWNWWRLRWEPRPVPTEPVPGDWRDWHCAHSMSAIGAGYAWPNVTVASDGFQCELSSAPSLEPRGVLFRYLGLPERRTVSFPVAQFERAVDDFVATVMERCDAAELKATNLHALRRDLAPERNNPDWARLRKLEALLGVEPDELPAVVLEARLDDAKILGNEAVNELAAALRFARTLPAQEMLDITDRLGVESDPTHAVTVPHIPHLEAWGMTAAGRMGYSLARQVRQQEDLRHDPISDQRLADLAGTTVKTLQGAGDDLPIAWAFNRKGHSRIVLRSQWSSRRRLDLARLIADRLFGAMLPDAPEPMSPVTRSYSYRQKAQRAFAAELLCPRSAVKEMLDSDYSEENQERIADYFSVSPLIIAHGLQNDEAVSLSG